jgi:hypothetical protein
MFECFGEAIPRNVNVFRPQRTAHTASCCQPRPDHRHGPKGTFTPSANPTSSDRGGRDGSGQRSPLAPKHHGHPTTTGTDNWAAAQPLGHNAGLHPDPRATSRPTGHIPTHGPHPDPRATFRPTGHIPTLFAPSGCSPLVGIMCTGQGAREPARPGSGIPA